MKVKATPTPEENDTITTLYEASINGCVSTLNSLIQRKPLILNRVSLSPFSETPLHIASLLGHLEFCEVLLKRKPSLASEADSEGRFPLHLACAEGNTEVVKALLLTNSDACFALDKDDMLPLHLAAMRGRIRAIQELSRARPESIYHIIDNDDGSVLHLCVRYNHLEALKFLVQSATMNQEFLLAKDKEGNTILHLAVKLKQIKTIKYLLMLPEMRTAVNALNKAGLTALEMLESCPRDFISLKIEDMLNEAGVLQTHTSTAQQGSSSATQSIATLAESPSHESKESKIWKTLWFKYMQCRSNWIEEKRGSLMVVATVIATMTFESVVSPPGGVWQEDTSTGGLNCTSYGTCKAGTAVLAYDSPHVFLKFTTFNTISFFCSLCVVVLLISGLRLDNKPMMWILIIALFSALTSMGHTYVWAQRLVTPHNIVHHVRRMSLPLSITGVIIPVVVFLFHVLHLVIFFVKKWEKKSLPSSKRLPVFIGSD
ncbi:ankyrin repeat-containing protein BDA1 [Cajanus cajan]|uniref:Ankyrin repeat-containing protein At3g12360 family n=1 Tax=Cajanus cajan TaxID=3821 RepID=A0A151RK21_CAJCA|nr:ankyrin repeat-containing protein BDA1 [Cajanus cajan]KYP42853.1 Ankyrin repeat-containing protein At3g12360 family [Cajanus cajan]